MEGKECHSKMKSSMKHENAEHYKKLYKKPAKKRKSK